LRWHDGALEVVQWADAAHLDGLPAQADTTPLSAQSTAPAHGVTPLAVFGALAPAR